MSIHGWLKGRIGEALGSFSQAAFLPRDDYRALNNLTLATDNGTTQIDHVIVSKFGIFVVEDKTVSGWIFGNARDPFWTVVQGRTKYRIQNPLHQNYRHVCAVVEALEVGFDQVHSVVVFRGDCVFRTTVPQNVLTRGYIDYIRQFKLEVFSDAEVKRLFDLLTYRAETKSFVTDLSHVEGLRNRYASTTVCPKCGGELRLRTAKTGAHPGSTFYGCCNYPRCRYTRGA